jgi:hypothetical protein
MLKLINNFMCGVELYDLIADPGELQDLSRRGDDTSRRQDMEILLLSLVEGYRRSARSPREVKTLEPSTKEALESLGYLQ